VPRRALPLATLVVALGTVAVLALVPVGSSDSCESFDDAPSVCTTTHDTLLDTEGAGVLAVLLVPAAIALVGVVRPTPGVLQGVTAALAIAVVLGIMSIGVFFVPTLLAGIAAAVGSARQVAIHRP
jgi:hypothetical protein